MRIERSDSRMARLFEESTVPDGRVVSPVEGDRAANQ